MSTPSTDRYHKKLIREEAFGNLAKLSLEEIKSKSEAIRRSVLALPVLQKATHVCLYSSMEREVQTDELIDQLLGQRKNVCLPRVSGEVLELEQITSRSQLNLSPWGILEPPSSLFTVRSSDVDVFIIPFVAADRSGTRLGWGKGYYDRLLEEANVPIIGLGFSVQIFPLVPKEIHDIVMDEIVTEQQVIHINKSV